MKLFITLFSILIISISSFAQGLGVNYKAAIKDNNGNLISNQVVKIRFTITDSASNTVYQETHEPTTDANGIVILSIGWGDNPSTNFWAIDWGDTFHFLETEIDTLPFDDYVPLGEVIFNSVPYAFHAITASSAETAENVSGLEAINEGNGTGWRLINKNPNNYATIGANAVDLSESENNGSFFGASGLNSLAIGKNARASGDHSIAIGHGTTAEGEGSIALGVNNLVEPNALFTIGRGPLPFNYQNAMVIYNDGKATFYEDLTVNRWLRAKDLFIAEDGMTLTGKLQRGSPSDMIPIAYGSVSPSGTINGGTGNFTVTKNTSHMYTISITGESINLSNTSTTVSPISGSFKTSSISHSGGDVRVHIFDSSFGQVANSFQFVIYRQ